MRAVGIIAEFDPFHDGHAHLIREAKRITGADAVVVAMSGPFVQRGAPSVFDKFDRACDAVKAGADAVFEIPAAYASSPAPIFCEAGIKLLAAAGVVDSVIFGSESGNTCELAKAADLVLEQEDETFRETLKKKLKSGLSYPAAQSAAWEEAGADPATLNILKEPNNILGAGYIAAARRYAPDMKIYTVKRSGQGYHESSAAKCEYPSSTSLRKKILNEELTIENRVPVFPDFITPYLALRLQEETADSLLRYADVNEQIAVGLMAQKESCFTFSELLEIIKSKNNIYTSISRALLHAALGLTKELRGQTGDVRIPYLRLLALNKDNSALLKGMGESQNCELVTKAADAQVRNNPLFVFDIKAASLYNEIVYLRYGKKVPDDVARTPVIVGKE